jgi:hypothetical protein
MKNLDNWTRLAWAAVDARDELRSLIPEFDQAISEKRLDVALLERRVRPGPPERGSITSGVEASGGERRRE